MTSPSGQPPMQSTVEPPKSATLGDWLRGIGVTIFFFAFAALINFMAPTYDLVLQRTDGQRVDARLDQTLIWFIPFRTQTLTGITDAKTTSDLPKAGYSERQTGQANSMYYEVRGTNYLHLINAEGELIALVAPEDASGVAAQVKDFLQSPRRIERFHLIADRLISVYITAIPFGLGCLFVLGMLSRPLEFLVRAILRKPYPSTKSTIGITKM